MDLLELTFAGCNLIGNAAINLSTEISSNFAISLNASTAFSTDPLPILPPFVEKKTFSPLLKTKLSPLETRSFEPLQ